MCAYAPACNMHAQSHHCAEFELPSPTATPTAKNPCLASSGVGFDSFDCDNSTRSTSSTVLFLSYALPSPPPKTAQHGTRQRDPKQQPQRSFSSEPREQRADLQQPKRDTRAALLGRARQQSKGLNLSVGFWSGVFFLGSIYFHRPFPSVQSLLFFGRLRLFSGGRKTTAHA